MAIEIFSTLTRFSRRRLAFAAVIVAAIRQKDGELAFHPNGDTRFEIGDLLIVIGKAEYIQALRNSKRT